MSTQNKMNTCRLDEIFDIVAHTGYDFKDLKAGKTPYVGASGKNNAVTQRVSSVELDTYSEVLSIALSGTVLATFYHKEACIFTPSKNITLISPKADMSANEFMFYKTAIEVSTPYFSYGRPASQSRVRVLQIPTRDSIPAWVYTVDNEELKKGLPQLQAPKTALKPETWEEYKLTELFDIFYGKQLDKRHQKKGAIAFVGSSDKNNGVTGYIKEVDGFPIYENVLTISGDGSVGEVFYHNEKIIPTNFMSVLKLKNKKLTPEIGIFLATVLKLLKFKYSYGRKFGPAKVKKEVIKLPTKDGKPDWKWMQDYMDEMKIKND